MRLRLFTVSFLAALSAGVAVAAPSVSSPVVPLRVSSVPTPAVTLNRTDARGSYPHVMRPQLDLLPANRGLRAAVVADQERFVARATRQRQGLPRHDRALYRTHLDRRYLSASSVVVSALMPATEEVFSGQHGGDQWLGITVRVPTGRPVSLRDLFRVPSVAVRALASAWKARLRATEPVASPCLRIYASVYAPTLANYRAFALTPRGLAVGMPEVEACYRLVAVIPYASLARYLSPLGRLLVAATRSPR